MSSVAALANARAADIFSHADSVQSRHTSGALSQFALRIMDGVELRRIKSGVIECSCFNPLP